MAQTWDNIDNMLFKRFGIAPLEEPTGTRNISDYLLRIHRAAGINSGPGLGKLCWRAITYFHFDFLLPLSFVLSYILQIKDMSMAEVLHSLSLSLNIASFVVKFSTLVFYQGSFGQANAEFDSLDLLCVLRKEQLAIRQIVSRCNKLILVYAVVYFSFNTFSLIEAISRGRAPFGAYIPFLDWKANRFDLMVQSSLEYVLIGYAVFVTVSTDTYAIVYIMALRQHLSMLREQLRFLGQQADETDDDIYANLLECISRHRIMLNICNIIRPIISVTVFAQFVTCGTILGITMIHLLNFADPSERFSIICYMLALMLQTFPLCYHCNCLLDDGHAVADELFHSRWMFQSRRYQRTVLQFLHQLQQPLRFMAMNIFNINLGTNINVAKFAFTAYAIASRII